MARRRPRTGSLISVMSKLPGTSDPLNDRIDSLVEKRRRAKEEAALKYGGGFGGRILYGMAESVFGERVAPTINDRTQLYNPSEQMTRGQGGSAVREIKPILEKINNKVDYLASKIEKIDARLSTKNITIGKGDKQQTFRYDPLAPEGKQVTAATASGRSGRFASKVESASVLSKAAYLGNQEYQMPQTSTRISQNDAKQIIGQLKKELTKSGGKGTQSQIAAAEDRKDYAAAEKDERDKEHQEEVIKKLDEILEKLEDGVGGGFLDSLLGGVAGGAATGLLGRLLPMLAPLLMNPYVLGAVGIGAAGFAAYKGIKSTLEKFKSNKKETTELGRTEGGRDQPITVEESGGQYVPQMPMPGMPVGVGFGGTNVPDKFELPKDETTVVETYYDGDELIGYLSTDGKLYVAQGKKEEVLERYRKGDATSVTVASGKMPDIPRQETTGASSMVQESRETDYDNDLFSSELPEGSMPIRNANNEVVGYRKEGGGYEALPGKEEELKELSKGANQLNREMQESTGASSSSSRTETLDDRRSEYASHPKPGVRKLGETENEMIMQTAIRVAKRMKIPFDPDKSKIELFKGTIQIAAIDGNKVDRDVWLKVHGLIRSAFRGPPPPDMKEPMRVSRELDEDFYSLPPSETPAAPTPKPAPTPKSDPTQPLINAAINAMSGSPFAKTKQPKEIPTTDNGKKSTSDQEALDARVNAADEILKYEELAREVAEINDQSVMFADGTTLKFDSQSRSSAYGIIAEDNSLGARDLENRLVNALEVRDGKEARNGFGDDERSMKSEIMYQFLMAKYYKDGLIVPPVDATLYDQDGNVIKVIKGKKSLGLTDKTYDSNEDLDMYELMDPEYKENQYKPEYVMPGTVGADKPTYMFNTPRDSSINEGVRVKEFEGNRVVPLSETAKLEIEETNRIRKEAGLPPVYDLAEHERRLEIQRKGDAIARGMAQDANIPLPPMLPLDKTNEALREAQTQLEMSEEENKTALESTSPVINNIDSRTINNVAPSSSPPPPMTVNSRNDETSYGDIAARIFSHPAKHPVA